jgi:photosystem II stability/assembly factor-like uncharacterized protein
MKLQSRAPSLLTILALALPLAPALTGASPASRPSTAATTWLAQAPVSDNPLARDLRWRNIGPANMTGRIAAVEALSTDYRHVLVASASGGLFRSTNAGITWAPIFDNSDGAGSIGAVAMFEPDPDVIWVGTGEAANRNSSGWGNGVFKTADGGVTWENVGLADTHHIAEIALHPTDPDIAYAASPGHLWGYSGSRGLFKTTDGGAAWTKLSGGLPDDGRVGATEIIMDPRDPDVLYAGMYHRIRQPATMYSGGNNGGIFKSADGGETWRRLSNGLAAGETGMIDLSIHLANPDIIVAAYEADENMPYDESLPPGEQTPGTGIYISENAGESWKWILRTNTRPFYHGQVQIDPNDPDRIFSVGRSFQVTLDGGQTWRGKWWSGGGDDHDFWIAPYDSKIFYTATDQGAHLTVDDGQTVLSFHNMALGQYYKIGVDMRDPYWVIGGLQDNAVWSGPSNSRETSGILNLHNTWLGEGDGFASLVDPTDYRVVYMANHVGFAMRLNFETREPTFITPTPETVVNFADYSDAGYQEEPIVYTIDPGEHWFRYGRPLRPLMPPHFRFNWNSPLTMSPSNPRVLYFGSNYLFKSVDRGDTWRIISPDLTTNDADLRNPTFQGGLTRSVTGGENHFTIFTVRESPLDPALVWAGTDDGNVQMTRNGGVSWTNVRDNLPGITGEVWVNRVESSHHDVATAYVALDNHRLDDMDPHVYVTRDFGTTFADITGNLPDGIGSYVILEDPVNPSLLFVGTEFGVYASIEGGLNWFKLSSGMPNVAVRDLVIHPREADLVAGTHGRAVWILDDITPLRQMLPEVTSSDVHLFDNKTATQWVTINLGRKQPNFLFRGQNPPAGAAINFWLRDAPQGNVSLEVSEFTGDHVATVRMGGGGGFRGGRGGRGGRRGGGGGGGGARGSQAGLNRAFWNFQFPSTATERTAMNERLVDAINFLDGRVIEEDKRQQLTRLRVQLADADNDRALNGIRNELAADFNGYADGRTLFGPQIGAITAGAGTYRITLTVDGQSYEGSITIRDDPMMTEHGGR